MNIMENTNENTIKVFNYIKNLPSIDNKRTVIFDKKVACENLGITIKELKETFLYLAPPPPAFVNNCNVIEILEENPDKCDIITIKWRDDPFQSFL
jgi:hypothetical protein